MAPLNDQLVTPVVELSSAYLLVAAATGDLRATAGPLLSSRPLVYAGQLSFAFYLVHELVLLNVKVHGLAGASSGFAIAAVLLPWWSSRERGSSPRSRPEVSSAAIRQRRG